MTQPDRIVAHRHGGIVWRGTGESDHTRLLPKAAWKLPVASKALAGN